jgi:hypothetical protein
MDNIICYKHSVNSLGTGFAKFRTVVTVKPEVIINTLATGDCSITKLRSLNPRDAASPTCYLITPNNPSLVAGSGVPAWYLQPNTAKDSWMVPSGINQGVHVYAENRQRCDTSSNYVKVCDIWPAAGNAAPIV